MSNFFKEVGVVLTGIVGLAVIAVLVSQKARTAEVVGTAGDAFANALQAAVSPITGSGVGGGLNTRYRQYN